MGAPFLASFARSGAFSPPKNLCHSIKKSLSFRTGLKARRGTCFPAFLLSRPYFFFPGKYFFSTEATTT